MLKNEVMERITKLVTELLIEGVERLSGEVVKLNNDGHDVSWDEAVEYFTDELYALGERVIQTFAFAD